MLTDGIFNDHDRVGQNLDCSAPWLTEFVLNFLAPWMLQPFLYFFLKAWYGMFDLLPGSLAGILCSVMQEAWI